LKEVEKMIPVEKAVDVFYQQIVQRYRDLILGPYPKRSRTDEYDGYILLAKSEDWHRTDIAWLGFKGFVIQKNKRIGVIAKGEATGNDWLTDIREAVIASWLPGLTSENWHKEITDRRVESCFWRYPESFCFALIRDNNYFGRLCFVDREFDVVLSFSYIPVPEKFVAKTEKKESGGYIYYGIPIARATPKTFEIPVEYKTELIDFLIGELEKKLNL
jgi:hypothetical protein